LSRDPKSCLLAHDTIIILQVSENEMRNSLLHSQTSQHCAQAFHKLLLHIPLHKGELVWTEIGEKKHILKA